MVLIILGWALARFMFALDDELKAIVAAPFNLQEFHRLGVLQARARSLGW